MQKKLTVIEVSTDIVVCSSADGSKVNLDIEGLAIQFEIGDEIFLIEHGFCDVYRGKELIAGLTNIYTRFIK